MFKNLTKYEVGRRDNEGDWWRGIAVESLKGDYLKVDDVKEACLKLQAKIKSLSSDLLLKCSDGASVGAIKHYTDKLNIIAKTII